MRRFKLIRNKQKLVFKSENLCQCQAFWKKTKWKNCKHCFFCKPQRTLNSKVFLPPGLFSSSVLYFSALNEKQGRKLVLSDALAVQFHGLRVSRSKDFKSQSCFGISKMYWDPQKWFGISKNILGCEKMLWDLKKCSGISQNGCWHGRNC